MSRGFDFKFAGKRYQVKANRPSGKPGSFVSWVAKPTNYDWDFLVWILYDSAFQIREAWLWEVGAYREQFESRTRLSPSDMRGGTDLCPPAFKALEPKIYRDVILDVRDQSVARGESPKLPESKYPKVPRGLLNLSIYLPFGSEAGEYHLRIYKSEGPAKPLLNTTGTAVIRKGITALEIRIDTNGLSQGEYTLETQRSGWAAGYRYIFRIAE